MLGRFEWAATFNPLYHLLEIIRAPLLGEPPSAQEWLISFAITACGCVVALSFFARFRARVAYWV